MDKRTEIFFDISETLKLISSQLAYIAMKLAPITEEPSDKDNLVSSLDKISREMRMVKEMVKKEK